METIHILCKDTIIYVSLLLDMESYFNFRYSNQKLYNKTHLIKYLENKKKKDYNLLSACKKNYFTYVKYYISNIHIHPTKKHLTFCNGYAFPHIMNNPQPCLGHCKILPCIRYACRSNKFKIVKYFLDSFDYCVLTTKNREKLVNTLCKEGNFSMVQELFNYFKKKITNELLKGGIINKDIMINSLILTEISFLRACESGNLDLVKFFTNNGIAHYLGIESATIYGNLSIIEYLKDYGLNFPEDTINTAAIHYDTIYKLKENSDENIFNIVKYLFKNNAPYNDDLLYDAKYCNYQTIKYILNNCPNSYSESDKYFLLEDIPYNDNPDIIDLLLDHDFYITPNAINEQCRRNNYHNVKKLISEANLVNENTLLHAVNTNNIKLVKLIVSINTDIIKNSKFKAMYFSQINNNQEIMEYLHNSVKFDVNHLRQLS